FRALATDDEDVVFHVNGETSVVNGGRANDDAGRLGDRSRRTVRLDQLSEREQQLTETFPRDGADLKDPQSPRFELGADKLRHGARIRNVDLVKGDDSRSVSQPAVRGELRLNRLVVRDGIALDLQRRAVDDVHEHRAALDVAEKVETQPFAGGCSRNQTGDVGDR